MVKVRDLEMLSNMDIIFDKKIILFGAGDYGKRALRLLDKLGISILGFSDSSKDKWGKMLEGNEIFSVDEVARRASGEDIIIIITMASPSYVEQVLEMLTTYGMLETSCYTYFALKFTVEMHLKDSRITDSFREEFNRAKRLYLESLYSSRVNIIRQFLFLTNLFETVFVLTPRKVGTTSVAQSLAKFSVHCLQTDRIRLGDWTEEKSPDKQEVLKVLYNEKKVKIISLVRDPIARALSDYFYGMEIYGYIRDYLPIRPDIYQAIIAFMEEEVKRGDFGYVFDWFDLEIKDMFGIDIYQYDFDKEKGYQIICKDNIELLLIKMEKLDECYEAIGQFVEIDDFSLVRNNVGEEKLYKFAYNELKRKIEIPTHIMDFYYHGNAAMDHFYTEREKRGFIKKWSHK